MAEGAFRPFVLATTFPPEPGTSWSGMPVPWSGPIQLCRRPGMACQIGCARNEAPAPVTPGDGRSVFLS